jgi:hypothetical protein
MSTDSRLASTHSTPRTPEASTHRRSGGFLRRWLGRHRSTRRSAPAPGGSAKEALVALEGEGESTRQQQGDPIGAGAYVTDGRSLFRIELTHTHAGSGETFVELENCTTLELSMCPADTLAARPLRRVIPVEGSEPDSTAFA